MKREKKKRKEKEKKYFQAYFKPCCQSQAGGRRDGWREERERVVGEKHQAYRASISTTNC